MTCKQIYESASSYALHDSADLTNNDYLSLVPSIVNIFSQENGDLADRFCESKGMNDCSFASFEVSSPTDFFPLPDRFAPAAAYFIAARLCIRQDGSAADFFQGLYENEIRSIRSEIPLSCEAISDVYQA